VVQNWPQIAADRYTYLPCLGWMLLIGTAVARLALANAGTLRRIGLPAGLVLVSLLLGALTWQQNRVWTNALTLWERVLAIEPNNFIGRLNYGEAWLAIDRPDLALPEFQSAVALHPWDDEAQTNLGLALIQLQRDDEATQPLQTAIELNPKAAKAHASLGRLLYKRGDVAGATNHFNLAVQADPADASIHASYGWQLRRMGQLDQAIAQLTIAVQQSPVNARYRIELAGALQDNKRYTEAADILREGLGLAGRDPNLLDALARLLATCPEPSQRHAEEAVRLAREACDSLGEHPASAMLETLALAHKAAGHKAEAVATLESAIAAARQNNEPDVLHHCQDELAQMRSNAP
jgi:tetratricopeptide (TPR) repeat protein